MRLRTDSAHTAGWRRARELGAVPPLLPDQEERAVEPAQIGDVWYSRTSDGLVVGYYLTCPRTNCRSGGHLWSHGVDCPRNGVSTPDHPSCWTWTGSAEAGDLSASPSLMVMTVVNGVATGACGFHGWLRNGVLSE